MLLIHASGEQQENLRKILNENPKTRERDLEHIKQWLLKQTHLPNTWDEHCLLTFLRGCKFSLETCKRKLDMYFTMRALVPEFFANRNIKRPELQAIWSLATGGVLPNLTPSGARVSIMQVIESNFETPDPADIFKIVFMVGDIRLKLEEGVMDTYIFDLDFPFAKHFLNALKMNPVAFKNFFVCVQEAYPTIIEKIHLINAPSFVEFAINLLKPLLSETLRNSIHVHTNIETLYDFVPKEILPIEYGGKSGKIMELKRQWHETLEEYSSWFESEEKIKADISKKAVRYENIFGTDGSFRELCID